MYNRIPSLQKEVMAKCIVYKYRGGSAEYFIAIYLRVLLFE
jgi:hypothetical protein